MLYPSRLFRNLQLMIIGIMLMACVNEDHIRKQILEETPIGRRMFDVKAFCVSKNLICSSSDTAGYWDAAKAVGVKSIWAVLSEYRTTPLTTTAITVYWGFDDEEKLVDVFVWRTIDAP